MVAANSPAQRDLRLGGAILVDKPPGMTSAKVVSQIKHKFKLKRVGHAGTLDPFATGLLVVLFGEATKFQSLFLDADKVYSGSISLGYSTDTDDVTGTKIAEGRELEWETESERERVTRDVERQFTGRKLQVPPKYSALKIQGERSYKLARQGKEIPIQKREIFIHSVTIEFTSNKMIEFFVHCSKGTYIRALARDIGEYLGTNAVLSSLRRVTSEPFNVGDAKSLEIVLNGDLEAVALPLESLVQKLPTWCVTSADWSLISRGVQEPLRDQFIVEAANLGKSKLAVLRGTSEEVLGIVERVEREGKNGQWQIRFLVTGASV